MKKFISFIISVLILLTIPFSVPVVANAIDADATAEQKQLEFETNKLLSGIKGNTSLNDIEKALLIHDRLSCTTKCNS